MYQNILNRARADLSLQHLNCSGLALLLILGLSACSGKSYDSQLSGNIVNSCQAQSSSKHYCQCALERMQEAHSQEELIQLEQEARITGRFPESLAKTMRQVSLQCKQ